MKSITEQLREDGTKAMRKGRNYRRWLRRVRRRMEDPVLREALRHSLHGRLLKEAFAGKDK